MATAAQAIEELCGDEFRDEETRNVLHCELPKDHVGEHECLGVSWEREDFEE